MLFPAYRKKITALLGALVLSQAASTVWAETGSATAPPPPVAPAPMAKPHPHENEWVRHSKAMLVDMKERLNITPEQADAWKAWSGDVASITQSQTERIDHWRAEHEKRDNAAHGMEDHARMTTPERMNHGLEHMRVEIQRMQDHVALLEKLQASTQKFYDVLDTNQKTIFDLYWQQAYAIGATMGDGMMGHHHGMMGHPPVSSSKP
ncbi:MAG: Spy/CpxP family protein refolding chaperone [Ferrovum sp.]|nr:Spy/CpxP family protein refolding chaperone [Ferrovum sp.]NDU87744.1 Spy/CpxP family protein refolding chaperone [Ferrovum sp.]